MNNGESYQGMKSGMAGSMIDTGYLSDPDMSAYRSLQICILPD